MPNEQQDTGRVGEVHDAWQLHGGWLLQDHWFHTNLFSIRSATMSALAQMDMMRTGLPGGAVPVNGLKLYEEVSRVRVGKHSRYKNLICMAKFLGGGVFPSVAESKMRGTQDWRPHRRGVVGQV